MGQVRNEIAQCDTILESADECRGTRSVSTDKSINIKNDNKNTNSNICVINLETTFEVTIRTIKENGSLAPEDIEEI